MSSICFRLVERNNADEISCRYNVIHPVPPFDNDAARARALDFLDNAGTPYRVLDAGGLLLMPQ